MERKKKGRLLLSKAETEIIEKALNKAGYTSCANNGENCKEDHRCIYELFVEMNQYNLN